MADVNGEVSTSEYLYPGVGVTIIGVNLVPVWVWQQGVGGLLSLEYSLVQVSVRAQIRLVI